MNMNVKEERLGLCENRSFLKLLHLIDFAFWCCPSHSLSLNTKRSNYTFILGLAIEY